MLINQPINQIEYLFEDLFKWDMCKTDQEGVKYFFHATELTQYSSSLWPKKYIYGSEYGQVAQHSVSNAFYIFLLVVFIHTLLKRTQWCVFSITVKGTIIYGRWIGYILCYSPSTSRFVLCVLRCFLLTMLVKRVYLSYYKLSFKSIQL